MAWGWVVQGMATGTTSFECAEQPRFEGAPGRRAVGKKITSAEAGGSKLRHHTQVPLSTYWLRGSGWSQQAMGLPSPCSEGHGVFTCIVSHARSEVHWDELPPQYSGRSHGSVGSAPRQTVLVL